MTPKPLAAFAEWLIRKAERRLGVGLDYAHHIAKTDFGLLMRYNRIFGFLDPNRKTPPDAYHAARLRGALAADCGTCVQAEIALARTAGLAEASIDAILAGELDALPDPIAAVIRLADAVTGTRQDAPEAREILTRIYGEAGMIELAFAMNGAALLPGIKRAMGYAATCDLEVLRRSATSGAR